MCIYVWPLPLSVQYIVMSIHGQATKQLERGQLFSRQEGWVGFGKGRVRASMEDLGGGVLFETGYTPLAHVWS